MRHYIYLIGLSLLLSSNAIYSSPVNYRQKYDITDTVQDVIPYRIGNSIGVLVADVKKAPSCLTFYNKDGSIWTKAAFNGDYKANMDKLVPYAVNEASNLLVLKCLGTYQGFYQVVANKSTGLIKYVKKNDIGFKFQTWESHLLKICCVRFNPLKNSLKVNPAGVTTVPFVKDEIYLPVKVQGDWLRVKWGESSKWSYGWIRWKRNGYLQIELFYDA